VGVAPQPLEDLVAGDDRAAGLAEQEQEIEGQRPAAHLPPADEQAPPGDVDDDVPESIAAPGRTGDLRRLGHQFHGFYQGGGAL
jgi:hypothetical protein